MPLGALAVQLEAATIEMAQRVLDEAKAAAAEPEARIDSVERRATTLQGTVAIAASAAVAAGGLLLGSDAVQGRAWRVGTCVIVLAVVLSFLACALRASQVTGRIFQFETPGFHRIPVRSSESETRALALRAAEILRAADVADEIATVKVGMLRSAMFWFRGALIAIAVLVAFLGAYALWGTAESPPARGVTIVVTP